MDKYYELNIKINPDLEEVVSDFFFTNFDCEGVILEEDTYKKLEQISSTRGTLKVFLREVPEDADMILKNERDYLLKQGLTEEQIGTWDYTIEEKENQDWSKKWKEKWDVTRVSDKIVVVPSWIEYKQQKDEIVITLDPGCAFGTGTHETTQLCMLALEKYFKSGQTMADIGTGSGILSILAKKLGAMNVYACDIDDTVIDVCYENANINNVSDIKFELNTADKITEKYDFVCANILHNVLNEIMSDLKNILKSNGILSLSGILDEKKDIVLDAIKRENLKIIETISLGNWISYVVTK